MSTEGGGVTDITPEAATIRDALLERRGLYNSWKAAKPERVRLALVALDRMEAALDAERARVDDAERRADQIERSDDQLLVAYKAAAAHNASLQPLVEAARDLCSQEADTYPALQKALADVDAG